MKRLFTAGVALGVAMGLCVVAAPSASAAGSEAQGVTPNATFGITLDGYCDTFTMNVPSLGSGLPHTMDGVHNLVGPCGSTEDYYDIGYASGPTLSKVSTEIEDGILVLYVFNRDGTWANYYDCTGTGTECLFLTGTWHYAAPTQGRRAGQRSSLPNK